MKAPRDGVYQFGGGFFFIRKGDALPDGADWRDDDEDAAPEPEPKKEPAKEPDQERSRTRAPENKARGAAERRPE